MKNLQFLSCTNVIQTRYPQVRSQGVIEPLPSQLKEVYTRYLSFFEEGELDIVQGEWIVKRRNYAATLNNRGSNTSKGFKTFSFGTFFYAQGLSKVLV